MENKIPTALELLTEKLTLEEYDLVINNLELENHITDAMIEFAKLHVKEALRQASEKACIQIIRDKCYGDEELINENSILNAYPEDNIK